MASVLSTAAHNTCMICLSALLVPRTAPADSCCDGSSSLDCSSHTEEDCQAEIGSVFPCGHVFHVTCFEQWSQHQERCPNCNQDATLFCKLFLTAPFITPPPAPPAPAAEKPVEFISVAAQQTQNNLMEEEEDEAAMNANVDDDEKEQRRILLDLRTATQAGPANAIRKVVSLRSRLRKLKREGRTTRDELESTRTVLDITQEELHLASEELEHEKSKVVELQGKLSRIQTQH